MIRVPQEAHDAVIAHCRRAYPKEACGILAGAASPPAGQAGDVAAVYPMANVEDSPIGYAMDPKEQLPLERQMREKGQRLLGIYHSHTASDAYPSPVDVRLAISPEISYVLVSLKEQTKPVFKSYRIDHGAVEPEDAVIEDGPCGQV